MSSSLTKINAFFKKISKPAKHGSKIGKGLASIASQDIDKNKNNIHVAIGQSVGIIAVPIVILLLSRLIKKIPKPNRRTLWLSIPTGLMIGSYLGGFAATSFLSTLPSSFDTILGMLAGVVVTTGIYFLAPMIYNKINQYRNRHSKEPVKPKKIFTQSITNRLNLGLEVGALVGAGIGASMEFVSTGFGFLGTAVGSLIGAAIGGTIAVFAPKLIQRYREWKYNKKIEKETDPEKRKEDKTFNFRTGLGIGSTYGSAIGVIIGGALMPGVGSIVGGMIGACIGGVSAAIVAAVAPRFFREQTDARNKAYSDKLSSILTCMKSFLPIGAAFGAILGTLIFPGIGTLVGAAIGGLVACAVGHTVAAVTIYMQNKKTNNDDKPIAEKNNYSFLNLLDQAKSTISFAAALGAVIGGIVGTFACPVLGSAFGAAIGAGIGASVATFLCVALPKITKAIRDKAAQREYGEIATMDIAELHNDSNIVDYKPEKMSTTQRIHHHLDNKENRFKLIAPITADDLNAQQPSNALTLQHNNLFKVTNIEKREIKPLISAPTRQANTRQ